MIRANYLLFKELAELSILNAPFPITYSDGGYPCFSLPASVKKNRFNGFFLTMSTGRSFVKGRVSKKAGEVRLDRGGESYLYGATFVGSP